MSNTRSVRPVPAPEEIELWDDFVKEAAPSIKPWAKRLADGTVLEVPCPSSLQIDALGEAQRRGDTIGMVIAVFAGENGADAERATKVVDMTAGLAFTVRIKLVNDVLLHYGMSLNQLPESAASSR